MYKQPYVKLAITIKLDGEKKHARRALFVYTEREERVKRGGGRRRWWRRSAVTRRHVAFGSSRARWLHIANDCPTVGPDKA